MSSFSTSSDAGDDSAAVPFRICRDTCSELAGVSVGFRQAVAEGPTNQEAHRRRSAESGVLRSLEICDPPAPAVARDAVKVAFWNLERCRHVEAAAAHLATVDADVNLLCELDLGMARTAQRHTTRDLAGHLQQGYAFAVEFVELGLGDDGERARHAGAQNASGLHGNALLSKQPFADPVLIRLDDDGLWFDGSFGERRIGGRIAVAAIVRVAGADVAMVCTHFESTGDPQSRTAEMRRLLAAVNVYAGRKPVIMAGDFNTNTTARGRISDAAQRSALLVEDPDRFANPVAHEPMFEEAAKAGFDWRTANPPGTTQRPHTKPRYERKLDWFFTRGLTAWGASIVSAVDPQGRVLSDHDMLSVMIAPETCQ